MPLPEQEFTAYLTEGIGEIGLTLTAHQIQQFFFIFGNYKSGIVG